MQYRIAFNRLTMVALVQPVAAAIPAGSNAIGNFEHADKEASINDLEFDVNHVVFQHVRDALYHTSARTGQRVAGLAFPENITDMAAVTISVPGNLVLPNVNVQTVENAA